MNKKYCLTRIPRVPREKGRRTQLEWVKAWVFQPCLPLGLDGDQTDDCNLVLVLPLHVYSSEVPGMANLWHVTLTRQCFQGLV